MRNVSDLLRQADPLNDEKGRLEDRRDQIRRTVVAVASVDSSHARAPMVQRRAVLAGAGVLGAALIGVIVGFGDRTAVHAAVRFEVRLAEERPVPGLIVAQVSRSGRTIYLHPELIVTNDDIAQSWVTEDGPDRFGVSVLLLEGGAQRMRQATAAHIGGPVAILIDGEVVAVPTVRSPIGNAAMISGDFTKAEAERIADGISLR